MKSLTLFFLLIISSIFILSCSDKVMTEVGNYDLKEDPQEANYSIDTRGYQENGEVITEFDCPDSKFFPPIDIKLWDKTPAVNGRLPTYKETLNGTSIHTYAGKRRLSIKPYKMTLPKLAYYFNGLNKLVMDTVSRKMTGKPEVVVVVQIVQTANDTVVGYRYLTGGVGGSLFHNFHFLTGEEIKRVVEP